MITSGYLNQIPSIVIDDSGDTTSHPQATLSPYSNGGYNFDITGLAPAPIIFGTFPSTPVSILGGTGDDTFTISDSLSANGIRIDGGGGNNTLIAPNTANTWTITGRNRGTLGPYAFANVQNLVGGQANDVFQFQTGGSIDGRLDGGGGVNTLDYSGDVGDVIVDLPLHLASQVHQMAPNSVFNIANVTGSQGNDLLVGDANPNVLVGGTGRNVIIGGGGGDTITGGGGDNLLIAGTTAYDNKLPALQALIAFWDSGQTFDARVNALRRGVTAQAVALVLDATTVHTDSVTDFLIGGAGQNWFVAPGTGVINSGQGPGPNDRLTRIKSA